MDIKRLEQYSKIKREIKNLENRIDKLQSAEPKSYPSSTTASSPNFPYTLRKIPIVAVDDTNKITAVKKLKKCLSDRETKLLYELNAIESFIDSIDDSEMRQIIQYRHIDGFGWQQIAFAIGEHDESYPRRKHKNFFKKAKLAENAVFDVI